MQSIFLIIIDISIHPKILENYYWSSGDNKVKKYLISVNKEKLSSNEYSLTDYNEKKLKKLSKPCSRDGKKKKKNASYTC